MTPDLRVIDDVERAAEGMWRWVSERSVGPAPAGSWPVPAADYWRDLARAALDSLTGDRGEPTEDLVARLRSQATSDEEYVALLERHVMEGLRVNVGLMAEITASKIAQRGGRTR